MDGYVLLFFLISILILIHMYKRPLYNLWEKYKDDIKTQIKKLNLNLIVN